MQTKKELLMKVTALEVQKESLEVNNAVLEAERDAARATAKLLHEAEEQQLAQMKEAWKKVLTDLMSDHDKEVAGLKQKISNLESYARTTALHEAINTPGGIRTLDQVVTLATGYRDFLTGQSEATGLKTYAEDFPVQAHDVEPAFIPQTEEEVEKTKEAISNAREQIENRDADPARFEDLGYISTSVLQEELDRRRRAAKGR